MENVAISFRMLVFSFIVLIPGCLPSTLRKDPALKGARVRDNSADGSQVSNIKSPANPIPLASRSGAGSTASLQGKRERGSSQDENSESKQANKKIKVKDDLLEDNKQEHETVDEKGVDTAGCKGGILKGQRLLNHFPYGCSSFVNIRQDKQFWKDNTRHIAHTVETAASHQMFLRPPRWGKSLFIDMLHWYLDINAADSFERLFGGTDIHDFKRQHNNKYYVMRLDLSIDVDFGDLATLKAGLYGRVDLAVERFCRQYGISQSEFRRFNALERFKATVEYIEDTKKDGKVFILIDEYDRFANKLMFENPDAYNKLVAGRSGDPISSPVRALFETIKSLNNARSFTVGLSPIALADALGVNFIDDISEVPVVGDLLGFTESDVRSGLIAIFGYATNIEPLMEQMKNFYNGYLYKSDCDAGVTCPLYHTQLCLYFFSKLCRDSDFRVRAFAGLVTEQEMMDVNTAVSDNVINLLIRQSEFAGIVGGLAAGCPILTRKVPSFRLRDMLSENRSASPDLLVSFMRWHGLLTMTPERNGYVIPNRVVGDAEVLLSQVIDAMNSRQYNIRTVINDPTDLAVWELHQAAFDNMGTKFDNSISERAIVGILEGIWSRQGKREGFKVFVEKGVGFQYPDLVFVDTASRCILILEYKRFRPGDGNEYHPDLCKEGVGKVQLYPVTSVSEANQRLLECEISCSKRRYHKECKTVLAVLTQAKKQVSDYAAVVLKRPEFKGFTCRTGVVIHATTAVFKKWGQTSYTSNVGVWLQEG